MALFRRSSRSAWQLRLLSLLLLLLVLLGLLGKTVYEGLAGVLSSPVTEPARTIPNTDVNPYGANFFLHREVEPWKLDKTLQMAAEAGIHWVKQQFPWEEIEPQRKGEFLEPTTKGSSWTKYDQIVAACEKYGLEIVARLDRPPDWTRQDNTYKERPPDNFADYGDFVYEFVKRYRGRINYIQIWNEPNIFPEWGNRAVNPAEYVELLKIAYRRAKEANPNVYVLSAPLAITLGQPHPEPGKWIAMSDLLFLEEMYKAGAREYFDILSANAFGLDRPPEDPPDPNVLNFQRVLLQRKIMERYGDKDKPIWFDEYGWNAAPASFPEEKLIWKRVSEQQQAEYTVRGIELARREWPWAGVFMVWYFRQVGNIPVDRADYYFRMVDVDFTPRLVYLAIQDVARKAGVAGPGLHQETNPAIKTYGRWERVIEREASGGAWLRSTQEGDSFTIAYRGSGCDLITQRGPSAGRLVVLLDGRPVPGLPTTEEGLSYLELYSPNWQSQARVPLVRHTTSGEHILRLTVAAEHHPAATGTICVVDAVEVLAERGQFPALRVGLLLLALGLTGWLLWRTWRRARWVLRMR